MIDDLFGKNVFFFFLSERKRLMKEIGSMARMTVTNKASSRWLALKLSALRQYRTPGRTDMLCLCYLEDPQR